MGEAPAHDSAHLFGTGKTSVDNAELARFETGNLAV